jgi:hypothetical protein
MNEIEERLAYLAAALLIVSAVISRLQRTTWRAGFDAGRKADEIRQRVRQEEPHD